MTEETASITTWWRPMRKFLSRDRVLEIVRMKVTCKVVHHARYGRMLSIYLALLLGFHLIVRLTKTRVG